MTTGPSFNRVFDRLQAQAQGWANVATMPVRRLRALIKDAGLSRQRAPRLQAMLRQVQVDFGDLTLEPLRELSSEEATAYLTSLPGVGIKTAKCVLMYALGREVLPIDTHVQRVAKRLGLLGNDRPASQLHDALERVVAPQDRYAFHVNAVAHGRAVCRARNPRCGVCTLRRLCPAAHL